MPATTYKLTLLTPAQRELEEIARVHLELAGADSARRITDQILDSLERLKTFPLSGSLPRDRWLEDYRKHGFSDAAARSYACMTQATIDTVEQAPEPDERGEVTLESYIQALVARGG